MFLSAGDVELKSLRALPATSEDTRGPRSLEYLRRHSERESRHRPIFKWNASGSRQNTCEITHFYGSDFILATLLRVSRTR